jgi:hypothetical protein
VTAAAPGTGRVHRYEAVVRALCAAADHADADGFAFNFAENATYRFANNEPLVGRAAIAAATAGAVDAVWPVRHQVDQVAVVDARLFCRFTILVSKPDGTQLALPCGTPPTDPRVRRGQRLRHPWLAARFTDRQCGGAGPVPLRAVGPERRGAAGYEDHGDARTGQHLSGPQGGGERSPQCRADG